MTNDSFLPVPSEIGAPFWEAAVEERFELQQCDDCDGWIYYPRQLCPECFSDDLAWTEASGKGRIHTKTTVHQTPVTAYSDRTPYILAIVKLREGPQMMANIVGRHPDEVEIGDPVSVTFEERGEGKIPQFEVED